MTVEDWDELVELSADGEQDAVLDHQRRKLEELLVLDMMGRLQP